jgi:hypothetical protein
MDKAVEYSGTEFFCQRFDLKLPQAFVLVAADAVMPEGEKLWGGQW